jgi:uncharacterized protein YdhG (YjbR/CyaY superfamily)
MSTKPSSVDGYLASLSEEVRGTMEEIRRMIRAAAPEAVEGMSYRMPGFKYRGRPLVYFAAAKNHGALYGPAVVGHQDGLAGYDTSKGTIRFPPTKMHCCAVSPRRSQRYLTTRSAV